MRSPDAALDGAVVVSLAAVSAVVVASLVLRLLGVDWSGWEAALVALGQIWLLAALTVPHMVVVAWLDRTREESAPVAAVGR